MVAAAAGSLHCSCSGGPGESVLQHTDNVVYGPSCSEAGHALMHESQVLIRTKTHYNCNVLQKKKAK